MKLLNGLAMFAILAAAAPSHSPLRRRHNEEDPPQYDYPITPDVKKVVDFIQDAGFWRNELKNVVASGNCKSPRGEWVNDKKEEMGLDVWTWLDERGVFDIPYLQKLIFDRIEHDEYIGLNGDETEELVARHQKISMFWESVDTDGNLDTHNVKLLGCHGSMLKNPFWLGMMLPIVALIYGKKPTMPPTIQNYIETNVPGGYDNPLFTFEFAAVPDLKHFVGGLDVCPCQAAIIVGDGYIEFLKDVGFGRDGPDFVLGHEWGHHMQHNVMPLPFDIPNLSYSDPETARHYELMADAFGGYFMAHDKGGNLSEEHIQELHEASFILGDCDFTGNDHHGTSMQRECSVMWGAAQAVFDSTEDKIMHPKIFRDTFDAALDDIIAVDESVCKTVAARL